MSKKDVDKYFDEIANNYHDMLEAIRDMEKEASNNLISPDKVEQLKEIVKPLKQNYERISYIMFLLNQPNKKAKKEKYAKINKKMLNNISKENTKESIIQENKETIENIKGLYN